MAVKHENLHVAVIVDEPRLRRERDWFSRTVVGLMSAGVRVTRILPRGVESDDRLALSPEVRYEQGGVWWMRSHWESELAASFGSTTLSVVHAMGRDVWRDAIALGTEHQCPVVLDVWSRREISAAASRARLPIVGGLFAASEALGNALKRKVPEPIVRVVPIGVYTPSEPRPILSDMKHGITALVLGWGASLRDVCRMLDGFALIKERFDQFMLFLDLDPRIEDRAWSHAADRGLLEKVSLIPNLEENRQLATGVDLVLIPSVIGEERSIVLQLMAQSAATIAVTDPLSDVLREPGFAKLLKRPTPEQWAQTLREALEEPSITREWAAAGRTMVAQRFSMNRQIEILFDSYTTIVSGGTSKLLDRREG